MHIQNLTLVKYFAAMGEQKKEKLRALLVDILAQADRRDRGQPIPKDLADDIQNRLKEFPTKIVKDIKRETGILFSRSDVNSDDGGKEARGGTELLRKAVKIALTTAGIGSAIVGTAAATTYGNRLGDDAYSATGQFVSAAAAFISNSFNGEPSSTGNQVSENVQQATSASTVSSASASASSSASTFRNGNVQVVTVPEPPEKTT